MQRTIVAGAARALALLAALLLLPAAVRAQTGSIAGTVVGPDQQPIAGVQVTVGTTGLGAISDPQGRFRIENVPAGSHQLRGTRIGLAQNAIADVTVTAGGTANVTLTMESAALALDPVVVSATRTAQRLTEAPAAVHRIGTEVLENSVGNTFMGALKEVQGLDFVQVGVTSVGVNSRGFNSSFNNRMLMMEDGRVAVLPESGLPLNLLTSIPKVDLAGIEVLVGPGAALYGPDASNGVVTLQTKDPRAYPGTTVEVTGGTRSYKDVQLRHAQVFGDFGFKVAGEWQDAEDFSNVLRYAVGGNLVPETGVGGSVDWDARVLRGEGALVWYADQGQVELAAGKSDLHGVGQTNVGRNQLDGYGYDFVQAKATFPRFYVNLYRAHTTTGDTYALNSYTTNRIANPGLTDEQVRRISAFPGEGQTYAAEVQGNYTIPQLNALRLIGGVQYRRDLVDSDRQWLSDRRTGEDVEIAQTGVYGQIEAPVADFLDLVVAARYDDHDKYEAQFSPKAGIVVKPSEQHAVRLTYNRAFKSPTILQTDFFYPDFLPGIMPFGNTQGLEVRRADGTVLNTFAPVRPEENQTWEIGYRGVIADRLFVDATGYRSSYQDFLSPLTLVNLPALGSFAFTGGQRLENGTGTPQAALIYFNLGEADLQGFDLGLNYLVSPRVNVKGTLSLIELDEIGSLDIRTITGAPDTARIRELSSLNSPETKWTLGVNARDLANFGGGVTLRHVNEYFFASGINRGTIPSFTTVDANVSYRVPRLGNVLLNLGVSNLFTCRGGLATAADADERDDKCGFDVKHTEMVNMPSIGTMVFLGVRYHIQ